MKIVRNKVLVAFDDHIKMKDGFIVDSLDESQRQWSVKGTVIQTPDKLEIFFSDHQKPYTHQDIMEMREMNWMSTSYDCDMELSDGDRVLFSYRVHLEPEWAYEENGVVIGLVDYDLIVAKLDPFIPINGFLMVEMHEKPVFQEIIDGVLCYNEDQNIYGSGVVVAAGTPLRGYLDFPDVEDDENIKKGSLVQFEKKRSARMEMDLHNSLTDKQSSLFRLHRKDVLMYKN